MTDVSGPIRSASQTRARQGPNHAGRPFQTPAVGNRPHNRERIRLPLPSDLPGTPYPHFHPSSMRKSSRLRPAGLTASSRLRAKLPHASENPPFEREQPPGYRADQFLSGTRLAPNSR